MKLEYLRAFIVLLAGLITLIINMKNGKPVTLSLLIVLIVIVIFYVIGTLTVEILQKGLENEDSNGNNSEVEMEQDGKEENLENEETVSVAFDDEETE